jgi:hypothetical protein
MPASQAEETYRFIRREAPSFADNLRTAARDSHNETELRTQVAHHSQGLAEVQRNLRELNE